MSIRDDSWFEIDDHSDRASIERKLRAERLAAIDRAVDRDAKRLLAAIRTHAATLGYDGDAAFDVYMRQLGGFSSELVLTGYKDFDPSQPQYDHGRSMTRWQVYHLMIRSLRRRARKAAGFDPDN